MVIKDEVVRERFREKAVDGKISCLDCMKVSEELQVATNEIATTLTEMHIKIIKCQLGCFP
jgi:LAO/AO transport system kinase